MSLITHATGQLIDGKGKCGALTFKGITMYISPLAPFNIGIGTEKIAKEKKLLSFVNKHNLTIQSVSVYNGEVMGVWIDVDSLPINVTFAFIPSKIDGDGYRIDSESIPPRISGDNISILDTMRYERKAAQFLMQLSIYHYARLISEGLIEKPEEIEDWCIIRDEKYDMSSIVTTASDMSWDNDVFFEDDDGIKMIVPSEEILRKLIYNIEVMSLRYGDLIGRYLNMKRVPGRFDSVHDLRKKPGQLIFTNRQSIKKWADLIRPDTNRNDIKNVTQPSSFDPYYYRLNWMENSDDGEIVMIQNVGNSSKIETAVFVSKYWIHNHVNLGWEARIKPELMSPEIESTINEYTIFTHRGEFDNGPDGPGDGLVLAYYDEISEGVRYAAILLLRDI